MFGSKSFVLIKRQCALVVYYDVLCDCSCIVSRQWTDPAAMERELVHKVYDAIAEYAARAVITARDLFLCLAVIHISSLRGVLCAVICTRM